MRSSIVNVLLFHYKKVRDASSSTKVVSTAPVNISSYSLDETAPPELSSGEEALVSVDITTKQIDAVGTETPSTEFV
jgi:hypothetical protein